jgi:hypothetical protein
VEGNKAWCRYGFKEHWDEIAFCCTNTEAEDGREEDSIVDQILYRKMWRCSSEVDIETLQS